MQGIINSEIFKSIHHLGPPILKDIGCEVKSDIENNLVELDDELRRSEAECLLKCKA